MLGGVWADRFGGKKVLGFGVIWWSLATACTPIAAGLGLVPLLIVRACMGIGEGVAMPAMNNMLSRLVSLQAAAFQGCLVVLNKQQFGCEVWVHKLIANLLLLQSCLRLPSRTCLKSTG